jgi:hypothetical protein
MTIKPSIYLLALTSLLHTSVVFSEENIFSCTTENHKKVRLYKEEGKIIYSFGKKGKTPEIKLYRKKDDLVINLENTAGRYISSTIVVRNKKYEYQLTTSIDRIADTQEPQTSITVMNDQKYLTSLKCIKGSEVGALINIDN